MYSRYAELRNARNLSDFEVAKNTGVAQQTLSAWKRGEYVPKADKLLKIAMFFGVSLEYLIGGESS